MKPVNRAMKDHPAYNRHTVYLFFFDQGTDAELAGYMPLNGRFGYITGYTAARQAEYYRTIAHEVAHVSDLLAPARNAAGGYKSQSRVLGSTFNLRHTFSPENRYVLSEGTTDNLLDYNGGTALYKYQWDLIHDPEKIWFAWMEEEGEGATSFSSNAFHIRKGIINPNASILKVKDFNYLTVTKTYNYFLNQITDLNKHVNTLIYRQGGAANSQASIAIGYIKQFNYGKNTFFDFISLEELDAETNIKNIELAIGIYYILNYTGELAFAHELFVHGITYLTAIEEIFKKYSDNNALLIKELKAIDKIGNFEEDDGGDLDHAKMLKGEKVHLTNYIKERLKMMNPEKAEKFLNNYISGLAMYLFEGNHKKLINYLGGFSNAKALVKKHLDTDFFEYKDIVDKLFINNFSK